MIESLQPVYDVIVIGAGVSGLSFARKAHDQGARVLVMEKSHRVGGLIESPSLEKKFWMELGAHTAYGTYTHLLQLLKPFGISFLPYEKLPYGGWWDGKFVSLFSKLHYVEWLKQAWRERGLKKSGLDLKTFYSKRWGVRNYEDLLQPAFSAVLCQNAEEYPAELLFPPRPPREKEVPKRWTMAGGLEGICEALAQDISLKQNVCVERIEWDGVFKIYTKEGVYEGSRIAIATPCDEAGRLLSFFDKSMGEKISQIPVSIIETFSVVFEKTKSPLKQKAGWIGKNAPFYSCVSRDRIPHEQYRGMTFHFKQGLLSKEEKIKVICDFLCIKPEDILFQFEKTQTLPALKCEHLPLLKQVKEELKSKPYFLLGNYFQGISIEDCIQRSEEEFQRFF